MLNRKIDLDYIKTDTEGADLRVLQGAGKILGRVVGIRCEAVFQENQKRAAEFPAIHQFLARKGFFLLNLEYTGRGSPFSYLHGIGPCGALLASDAIYLKKPEKLKQISKIKQIKAIIFCFISGAPDIGLFLLKEIPSKTLQKFPKLLQLTEKLFLKEAIAVKTSRPELASLIKRDFKKIFKKKFPDRHHYYQSLIYNPS